MRQNLSWLPTNLSQLEEPVRHRRGAQRHPCQARDHVAQLVTSVEAVLELSQVAWDVLLPNGMIGSRQAVFEVPQHRVGPFKGRVLNRLFAGARHNWLMMTPDVLNS